MADRIATAVWAKPRRRIVSGLGLAAFVAAVVLLAGALSTVSRAARTSPVAVSAARQQAINGEVTALINKMTVAEKFGQLEMAGPDGPNGTPGDLLTEAKNGQIGSVLDLVGVANINAGPAGCAAVAASHPADLRARRDPRLQDDVPGAARPRRAAGIPPLVQNDEAVSADEATADGIKWTFNPMVDISRDPRWGRVVEGAGEDPFLGSAIAAAKVRGYQGSNFAAPDKMAATIKHFGAYGAPVAGANTTRSTCRPSSCSTTTCRPTRRRSTPAPRR